MFFLFNHLSGALDWLLFVHDWGIRMIHSSFTKNTFIFAQSCSGRDITSYQPIIVISQIGFDGKKQIIYPSTKLAQFFMFAFLFSFICVFSFFFYCFSIVQFHRNCREISILTHTYILYCVFERRGGRGLHCKNDEKKSYYI